MHDLSGEMATPGLLAALAVASAAVLGAGCASSPPPAVSPARQRAVETALLRGYQEERAVVCDRLAFDISANFNHQVARPAIQPSLHSMRRAVVDGDDVTYWTSNGGLQSPLRFMVGRTKFVVLQSATLRVRGSGEPMAMNAHARGNVTVSQDGKVETCAELTFVGGQVRRR